MSNSSSETCIQLPEHMYQKGVKHLCENGVTQVPKKYILSEPERPHNLVVGSCIDLPVIDFAQLQGNDRPAVLRSLAKACQEYGFFQLTNHGITNDVVGKMIDVSKRFFELPFEERQRYMSSNLYAPVRYGTSFNQNNDGVFCWRDFLKLSCYPMQDFAILASLGVMEEDKAILDDANQLTMVNCYPSCPQPQLTLGLPPHSDYGLLTLLLQDQVEGLQIQHKGRWLTVKPIPNSLVVNIGDQFEIFSNGRYKSVVHRVAVNSMSSRLSVATLFSLPVNHNVRPSPELIDESNPRRYRDTNYADFLEFLSSSDFKCKKFLELRKLR
ncbi:Non-heme dioxygenase N-terminal domain-containing protein [Cynara cardunculus var. scolymus]|uniref:Non-heme dioxygenase N-terminal domain-containing protein n=1 Tax=Cynara cardunculus var. scolymus TaxID=59895 RepID=A0A103Y9N7_CYNCS|nr:Non-heme dioxygenase N-terminal domain-containing protein [Cynara cardunculus var. scolymus]